MTKKKVYELWWEYLNRSDKYEKFCQLMSGNNLPESPNIHLLKTWEFFGDVFNKKFDDWWSSCKIPKLQNSVVGLKEAIDNQSTYTKFRIKTFSQKNKRPPSIYEFVQFHDPEFIYLRVSMIHNLTSDDIAKQIVKLRKKQKKAGLIREESSLKLKRYYHPTGKIVKQLKDYLRIYDLQKRLKWYEVMMEEPLENLDAKGEHRTREYKLYKQKAKAIIKNVEEGYFPGLYSRKSKRMKK